METKQMSYSYKKFGSQLFNFDNFDAFQLLNLYKIKLFNIIYVSLLILHITFANY